MEKGRFDRSIEYALSIQVMRAGQDRIVTLNLLLPIPLSPSGLTSSVSYPRRRHLFLKLNSFWSLCVVCSLFILSVQIHPTV